MTATPEHSYRYETIVLSARFNHAVIPIAIEGKAGFLPVVAFCDLLSINKRNQADALKGDGRFLQPDVLREVPFRLTEAGWRMVLSIRRDKLGLWLLGIDPERLKPESRGQINYLQEEVSQLTDRLIFGARTVPVEQRGVVEVSGVREYRFPCEDCGAWHILRDYGNGDVEVMRDIERTAE